jgi:hypothetical protein
MFDEMQQQSGFAPAASDQVAQRQFWRRQLRTFDETLRRGDPQRRIDDQIDGIQEMLDSGAMTIDDNGDVYTAVPGVRGKRGNQRLLDAARTYNDWYQDQIAHGEDLPYRNTDRRMQEGRIDPQAMAEMIARSKQMNQYP